jgi:Fe-S-cluster containining protein
MEKDPQVIARLAVEREDENWRFRTFLKHMKPVTLAKADRLTEEFGRAAEAAMDCTACGACCRDNCVPVSVEEQIQLASRLGISPDEFREQYLGTDDDGQPAIEATPCPFLKSSRCSVYEDRPQACRDYPYVGGNVASRMVGIIERAGTCPIIFEMLERLKGAVWGSSSRKEGEDGMHSDG